VKSNKKRQHEHEQQLEQRKDARRTALDLLEGRSTAAAGQSLHAALNSGAITAGDAPGVRFEMDRQLALSTPGVVQRDEVSGGLNSEDAQAAVAQALRAQGGARLDPTLRAELETAVGIDLESARIHTGAEADRLCEALRARAFTAGDHVFVRSDLYAPNTHDGRALLVHELTHVRHQRMAQSVETIAPGLAIGRPDGRHETEAHAAADAVRAPGVGSVPGGRRQALEGPARVSARVVQREEETEKEVKAQGPDTSAAHKAVKKASGKNAITSELKLPKIKGFEPAVKFTVAAVTGKQIKPTREKQNLDDRGAHRDQGLHWKPPWAESDTATSRTWKPGEGLSEASTKVKGKLKSGLTFEVAGGFKEISDDSGFYLGYRVYVDGPEFEAAVEKMGDDPSFKMSLMSVKVRGIGRWEVPTSLSRIDIYVEGSVKLPMSTVIEWVDKGLAAKRARDGAKAARMARDAQRLASEALKREAAEQAARKTALSKAGRELLEAQDKRLLQILKTGDKAALRKLTGIGPKRAAEIIKLRDAGKLEKLTDLKQLKGFKDHALKQLRGSKGVDVLKEGAEKIAANSLKRAAAEKAEREALERAAKLGTKEALELAEKEAAEEFAKRGGKATVKEFTERWSKKIIGKVGAKMLGKAILKFIPFVNIAMIIWDVAEIGYALYKIFKDGVGFGGSGGGPKGDGDGKGGEGEPGKGGEGTDGKGTEEAGGAGKGDGDGKGDGTDGDGKPGTDQQTAPPGVKAPEDGNRSNQAGGEAGKKQVGVQRLEFRDNGAVLVVYFKPGSEALFADYSNPKKILKFEQGGQPTYYGGPAALGATVVFQRLAKAPKLVKKGNKGPKKRGPGEDMDGVKGLSKGVLSWEVSEDGTTLTLTLNPAAKEDIARMSGANQFVKLKLGGEVVYFGEPALQADGVTIVMKQLEKAPEEAPEGKTGDGGAEPAGDAAKKPGEAGKKPAGEKSDKTETTSDAPAEKPKKKPTVLRKLDIAVAAQVESQLVWQAEGFADGLGRKRYAVYKNGKFLFNGLVKNVSAAPLAGHEAVPGEPYGVNIGFQVTWSRKSDRKTYPHGKWVSFDEIRFVRYAPTVRVSTAQLKMMSKKSGLKDGKFQNDKRSYTLKDVRTGRPAVKARPLTYKEVLAKNEWQMTLEITKVLDKQKVNGEQHWKEGDTINVAGSLFATKILFSEAMQTELLGDKEVWMTSDRYKGTASKMRVKKNKSAAVKGGVVVEVSVLETQPGDGKATVHDRGTGTWRDVGAGDSFHVFFALEKAAE
jgi:DNA uptake protein ComE-like DNA-binding protein